AAPLVVQRGPTGALVIETPTRVEPTEDDLELLTLFSSQAAIAVRNTHELERLRSGALAALGRMATQVAHEIKNPLAGLRLYARHLGQRLSRAGDAEGQELAGKIAAGVDHLADVVAEITAFGRPPELHRAPTNVQALLDECPELAAARFDATAVKVVRERDPAIADGLRLTLESEGYTVRTAGGVRDALAAFGQYEPHAAIVDLMLPDDDGLNLTRELRRRDPSIQVIVITAYGSVRKAMEATKGAGAFHVLEKPFDPDELLGLVRSALDHRKLVVENTALRRRLAERA